MPALHQNTMDVGRQFIRRCQNAGLYIHEAIICKSEFCVLAGPVTSFLAYGTYDEPAFRSRDSSELERYSLFFLEY